MVNKNQGAASVKVRFDKLPPDAKAFDLWYGLPITIDQNGTVATTVDHLGAIAIVWGKAAQCRIDALLRKRSDQISLAPRAIVAPTLRLASRTKLYSTKDLPNGMSLIAAANFRMTLRHPRRECGCYPDPGTAPDLVDKFLTGTPFDEQLTHDIQNVHVNSFLIDTMLVTNAKFEAFLNASHYKPSDTANFLKHWNGTSCPEALRNHPVVYIDLNDARAYARWAGKRLPTEAEWQLAGQGTDGRIWPWGSYFSTSRCNGSGKTTTPVDAFPGGRSPSGCYDMTGNVWQWTESEWTDGHSAFAMLRGGSFYNAAGSIWYFSGGAKPLDYHAKFILLSPRMDRCATIGFRCVTDCP